ncbi:sensory box histidine kinase PhoR [Nonomuraea antimicrobica]|uniref:histidine kinase n=1 Tax=Nonomuraea antimicrobica TaxID=561173 RepID=A0ABP7EA99_9ACTN
MRPASWTLRTRLVLAVLGLAALALLVTNVVSVTLLRDHLVGRVDEQLDVIAVAADAKPIPLISQRPQAASGLSALVARRVAQVQQILVYNPDGTLLMRAPEAKNQPTPVIDRPRADDAPYTVPGTDGADWRVRGVQLDGGDIVVVAQSLAEVEQAQRSASVIAFAAGAFALLLLGLAAGFVVRLGLRPLTRMEATAGQIARGDLALRVHAEDPRTEPGRLATAMNVMLDRLQSEIAARTDSEARMRRFLADASHELRTPLTSVRGFAELHRRGGDAGEAMSRIEHEAARMGVLVNDLLTLAQLDEERPLDRHPVDLLEVAADTIRDARVRVPDRPIRLTGLGDRLAPVSVVGDDARLRQVAANLVGNALCHTPPEASVTVRVGTRDGLGVLEVADTGPGVPPEHVPRVFDRLYRASRGRSRADGGTGLGLAIVSAIVRAHGGRVELDTAPGRGATFRVLLPGTRFSDAEPLPGRELPPDSEAAPSSH